MPWFIRGHVINPIEIGQMEAISVAIGIAAAKFAVRLWTQDAPAEVVGDDLVGFLGGSVQGELARREVRRQLDKLADHIAERMAPFLSGEVGGVESNELEAAALAAQESLNRANALDVSTLIALDLDSARLTKLIRQQDPEAVQRAGLGDAGAGVYDTLVAECANYVVCIATQLPGFKTREAQELLSRQSRLAELAAQILENLPPSQVPLKWGPGSEDQRFENKYRHAVREYAEQLQLFGVMADEARRPYPLSVAYISMAVDEKHAMNPAVDLIMGAPSKESTPGKPLEPDEPARPADSLRVETLLADTDRLLLTGGAGSGKTTLIQWIALSSVASSTGTSVPEDWTDRVPFVLPLRRFVGSALPTPKRFVEQIAPNLAEAMPSTWVHRVLADGRGTVLIDGLDEIPHADRDDALKWVRQLIRDFPSNKFLVTSRTTAVTKGWREDETFRHAELLPMEIGDIRAFISHWHDATRQVVDDLAREEVSDAERSLLGIVRDRPAIRALCNSPLLGALICALHLQNGASLPSNRMDVYRTAIEMLVHKRDNDRRVRASTADVDFTERQIILRSFALWLHENGAADATRKDFDSRVERTLTQLHRVKASPDEVASFMLERSGVLREPISGRVDFVHRTFLEYLAASSIIDDDSIDKLIRMAHDDHWREVIILAAGHANSEQRAQLLRGLLKRGADTPRRTHRLFLLAVACMETSPQLPKALRGELEAALRKVLPPRNMTEAMAVASAGELAVPLLESFATSGATVAAASVRALSLIGGEHALGAMAAFRSDSRVTVTRQLIRAWSYFDTGVYAREILSHSTLDRGLITISDVDQLAHVSTLTHAERVFVSFPRRFASASNLPKLPANTYGVDLSGLGDVQTISDIDLPQGLRSVSIRNSSLQSLGGLERHPNLGFLSVAGCTDLSNTDALLETTQLRYLDLSGTAVRALSLGERKSLGWLMVHSARHLEEISEPLPVVDLSISYGVGLRDVTGLASSGELRQLSLNMGSLSSIEFPPALEQAYLSSWAADAINITGGEALRSVSINATITSATLDWIVGLPHLGYVAVDVRDEEVGGWSPNTAVAELCARSNAVQVAVSIPYNKKVELPNPAGWTRHESISRLTYVRE
ncbi:NACHT domain-containing protein [Agromyces sp. NPDC058484]|uniref:NACHT domain-containing protein n=1 Tax=Agromyces sp. NPDC058484 TaxID=3346524 RepID=UPI00365BE945